MGCVVACSKLVSSAIRPMCLRAWGVLASDECCPSFSIPTKARQPCKTAADEHPSHLQLAAKSELTHPTLARISRKIFALKKCVQKLGRQPSEHARALDKYGRSRWTHLRCKWDGPSLSDRANQPCVPSSSRASWSIWETRRPRVLCVAAIPDRQPVQGWVHAADIALCRAGDGSQAGAPSQRCSCFQRSAGIKELMNIRVRQKRSSSRSWDLANTQAEGHRVYLRNEQK